MKYEGKLKMFVNKTNLPFPARQHTVQLFKIICNKDKYKDQGTKSKNYMEWRSITHKGVKICHGRSLI